MSEPIVSLKNVSKDIGNTKILKNVNLEVFPQEIHVLIGVNGAGKTTTLKCALGLLKISSGISTVFGEASYGLSEKKRQLIGTVLDENGLYNNLTGRDNIMFFGELYGYNKAATQQKLAHYSKLLDLEVEEGKKVGHYSKGMKQKLCIIRELIHEPQLLVLDEPFNGLDPAVRVTLRNFLTAMQKEGMTIIISSHDLYDIEQIGTHVSMVSEGSVIKSEPMQSMDEEYSVIIGSLEDIEKIKNMEDIIFISHKDNKVRLRASKNKELIKILIKNGIGIDEIYKERSNLETYFKESGNIK